MSTAPVDHGSFSVSLPFQANYVEVRRPMTVPSEIMKRVTFVAKVRCGSPAVSDNSAMINYKHNKESDAQRPGSTQK